MPKPVKKAAAKPATKPRKPSSDPVRRAHQMMAEMEAKQATGPSDGGQDVTPPHGDTFEEQYRARMAELGRKGGKVGGKRRLETMTAAKRKAVAKKAAAARWKK